MSAPNATMTPFSGWRGRSRRSRSRNRSQPALSAPASLSCVVYRPAVSMSTACSAIHQSQLRVPPTPGDAAGDEREVETRILDRGGLA